MHDANCTAKLQHGMSSTSAFVDYSRIEYPGYIILATIYTLRQCVKSFF